MLVDGWLWGVMGLMAVGFIVLALRLWLPRNDAKVLKGRTSPLFGPKQIREWERMFAWRPVQTIDAGMIWLKYYWQRQIYTPATVDGKFKESYISQNVVRVGWYLW